MKSICFFIAIILFFSLFESEKIAAQNPQWINFARSSPANSIAFQNDSVWIGTEDGVFLTDINGNVLQAYDRSNSAITGNIISKIMVDKKKNIWAIVFNMGIVSFDGNSWTSYDKNNSPLNIDVNNGCLGNGCNDIKDVEIDSKGNKWIALSDSIYKYNDTIWTSYAITNFNTSSYSISEIYIDKNDNIWIAATNGIYKYEQGSQLWINIEPMSYPELLTGDLYGNIYVEKDGYGISKFDGNIWSDYLYWPNGSWYLSSITFQDSIAWIGTSKYGLIKSYQGNTIFYDTTNTNLKVNDIRGVAIDKYSRKWLGLNSEPLMILDDTSCNPLILSQCNISDNFGFSVVVDSSKKIWFGNNSISSYADSIWTTFSSAQTNVSFICALVLDKTGNLWCGSLSGLSKYDGKNWTFFSDYPGGMVQALAFDSNGVLWIGARFGGLVSFDGYIWTSYTTSNSNLPSDDINSIYIDTNGIKWLGTNGGGLVKFDNVNWTVYNKSNSGICSDYISYVTIDKNNGLWIGSGYDRFYGNYEGHGLSYFYQNNWTTYDTSNSNLSNLNISGIAIDKQNNKWIATNGGGLAKFDGTNWELFDISNSGVQSDWLTCVYIDNYNNKWLGSYGYGFSGYNENGLILYDTTKTTSNISKFFRNTPQALISPNPANDYIVIDAANEKYLADIYSAEGERIISSLSINENSSTINIASLSKGFYLIKLSNKKKCLTYKLIKQ